MATLKTSDITDKKPERWAVRWRELRRTWDQGRTGSPDRVQARGGYASFESSSSPVSCKRDYAVCPGKLALLRDGRLVATRSAGRTCVEVINDGGVRPGAPGWQDPRLWGTRARYAAAAGTIELVTLQQGRLERACTKTLRIR